MNSPKSVSDYDFDSNDLLSNSRLLKVIMWIILVTTAVSLVVVIIGQLIYAPPAAFELHFTPYAIFSAVGMVGSIIGCIMLLARSKRHTLSLAWFTTMLALMGVWSFAEMMMRLSATPETFNFWAPVSTIGSAFVAPIVFIFSLTYVRSRFALHPALIMLMLACAMTLLYADLRSTVVDDYSTADLVLSRWGYNLHTGPLYGVLVFWDAFVVSLSVAFIFRYSKASRQPEVKAQARMIAWAILLPVLMAVVTDGIMLPTGLMALPPLGPFFTSATGMIVTYAILHYRYLTFTPSYLAGQVLNTMNEAVLGLDKNFVINFANTGAERLLGMKAQSLLGKNFTAFSRRHDSSEIQDSILGALGTRSAGVVESIELRSHEGTLWTAKLSVTRVSDKRSVQGYIVVCTDITQLARVNSIISRQVTKQTAEIRKTRTQLITAINSVQFGFFICDDRPEILMVNDVAHRIFCGNTEHSSAECHNVTLDTLRSAKRIWSPIVKSLETCLTTKKPQGIGPMLFNDHTWRIAITPVIEDDKAVGAAIVLQDITEEQILQRSRDEFFSIASHELRTPLTSIRGNSAMILQYYGNDIKDDSMRGSLEDIHDSSVRLIDIVNDFLDVSRIEQGKIHYRLEPVKADEIIESVTYEMGTIIREKHLNLKLEEHSLGQVPDVIADKDRLKQVVYNLVSNAVKYTEPHGDITIAANVMQSSETVRITIADTGVGIPPENRSLLFHKFQQAGESLLTRDTTRGTGLGLYISRLLVTGMGGSLKLVRSAVGKGSTFAIDVPIATEARLKHLDKDAQIRTDERTGLATTK